MNTLECSSKGDKRYSAMYALINGISIEKRYQLSKRFYHNGYIIHPTNIKQAKHWQYKDDYILLDFMVNKVPYSLEFLSTYYNALWYVYLNANQDLIANAKLYNNFTDFYRKPNTKNCQADIIALVVNQGLEELKKQSSFFIDLIK